MIFQVKIGGIPLWQRIIEQYETHAEITATCRQWSEGDYIRAGALINANSNVRHYGGQVRVLQPARTGAAIWWRRVSPRTYQYSNSPGMRTQWQLDCAMYEEKPYTSWLHSQNFKLASIYITSLEKLDLCRMTDMQAQRTGFASAAEYVEWWAGKYGADKMTGAYIGFAFMEAE